MYDLVENLIDHAWQSNYTSDQQYIYYIVGTLIVIITVFLMDCLFQVVRKLFRL